MNSEHFRKDADLLLGGLAWTRADANAVLSAVKGEQPRMKRKLSLGLVLTILLILLAAVALAIGLTYSPRYTTVQTARKAVMEKYGLTADMLRLYGEAVREDGGTTTVTYTGWQSEFLMPEPMGEYTATVDGRGHAVAAWSHDGTDASALETGDLTSTVWGPKQLQMALDRYDYYQQWNKDTPYLYLLPVAEQAKRVAELDAAIAPCFVRLIRTEVPDESDMPEEEALTLAKQAVKDTYGTEITDQWTIARSFQKDGKRYSHGRCYSFIFQRSVENGAPYETHQVWVQSPFGQVITEKDEVAAKLADFAPTEASPSVTPNPAPAVGLTAKQAVAAARQALTEWYHLTEDMLNLFISLPSLDNGEKGPVWTVAFLPVEEQQVPLGSQGPALSPDWRWSNELIPKLGSYLVWLDAETGEMRHAAWSLDTVSIGDDYTESNWVNAEAYDARILQWVVQLLKRNAPILAKYTDEQHDWFTVEDAAAYDQAFRDAGFDAGRYNHGLPKEGDLTADQALMMACQAMKNEYGLTQEDIDNILLTCEYLLDNGGEWRIGFYSSTGMGSVTLNATTGEIQQVYLDSAATSVG